MTPSWQIGGSPSRFAGICTFSICTIILFAHENTKIHINNITNNNLELSLLYIYTSGVFLNLEGLGVLALSAVFLKYWTMAVSKICIVSNG